MVCLKSSGKGARQKRTLVAAIAVLSFAGAASAQSANPFAFLFGGGAPREGRSAYVPAPAYVPPPSYGGSYASPPRYSSLPGYSEPDYAPRHLRRPHPRSLPVESAHQDQSPKDVMAAIKAIKPGKGPLGPFVNDPTLRAGDVVVTTKGLMVYRGDGGTRSHNDRDFVSVASASSLIPNSSKQQLISLETASRLTPQKPLGVESKPSRQNAPEVASSATAKSSESSR